MLKFIDLTRQQFNKLIVVRYCNRNKHNQIQWLCKCSCGKETIVTTYKLKSGHTKSCGCLKIEKLIERSTRHTHSTRNRMSTTYKSWSGMIQRCTNKKEKQYADYGGRGISVCDEWLLFVNFLKDMGEKPNKNHQIDRINNDSDYCKSNCRWATAKQNNRNKRNNHLETYKGKTQSMIEWTEEYNILYETLQSRLNCGWSIEKALMTPVRNKKKIRKA